MIVATKTTSHRADNGVREPGQTEQAAGATRGAVGHRIVSMDDHSASLRLESRDHIAMR
jgi:hypothetical protein